MFWAGTEEKYVAGQSYSSILFFHILQIYGFQHYTALTSQIRNAQWIETDLVENLFVIVSRIKLFLHSKDHSVGNQIIKFHSIFCTFRFEPIPIAAPSIFCNSKLITFYFLHILFSAHSIFCTFHFLPIPFFAHSSFRTFHFLPIRLEPIPFFAHSSFRTFNFLPIPYSAHSIFCLFWLHCDLIDLVKMHSDFS